MKNKTNKSGEILLSICIPTYNRIDKLKKLINNIIKCSDLRFEIIISDNISTDNTYRVLSEIIDNRLKIFVNEENIGSTANFVKSLTLGSGKFVLFCTDKDSITSDGLSNFLSFLNKNSGLIAGFNTLDIYEEKPPVYYQPGIESLFSIGYLCKHPTGYFFNRSNLLKLNPMKRFSNIDIVGAFPFEFIIAELCLMGKTSAINIPMCYTESKKDASKTTSFTYLSSNKNMYFYPLNRMESFIRFVNQINSFSLSKHNKRLLISDLFNKTLIFITLAYKNILNDKEICIHHCIECRKVTIFESIFNDIRFCFLFIFRIKTDVMLWRISIVILVHFNFILKKIKSKINLYIH